MGAEMPLEGSMIARSATAYPCWRTRASRRRNWSGFVMVLAVYGANRERRKFSCTSLGACAMSTCPAETACAGSREAVLVMLTVGCLLSRRSRYSTSWRSRTPRNTWWLSWSRSFSRCGRAVSRRLNSRELQPVNSQSRSPSAISPPMRSSSPAATSSSTRR